MSEEKFDAIIVGGGMAGATAAYILANAGMEVLLADRGDYCGAKNVTGGRLYAHSMEKVFPGFAKEAPVERLVTKEKVSLMTEKGSLDIGYSSTDLGADPDGASYTVLRSKFDQWMAEKCEEAGVMLVPGIRVDSCVVEDGKVVGIDAGRWDTVIADVTATDERREKYDFSDPYLYTGRQVVVKKGNEVNMHTLDDIAGKKVATNTTNSWASKLEDLGATIVPIDNTDQCASAVINGSADFCMFNNIVMSEYLKNHPEAELEVAFVIETDVNEVSIPVRKGETRLLEQYNAALAQLRESGKLKELSEKWFYDDLTNNPLGN